MRLHRFSTARPPYAGLPFFRGWSDDDLRRLQRLAEELVYAPGEVLVTGGTTAREALVIVSGAVRAGDRVLGPGDTIGAEAVLTRGDHATTVVARTDVTVLYLGSRELHGLLQVVPAFGRSLSTALAGRLAATA